MDYDVWMFLPDPNRFLKITFAIKKRFHYSTILWISCKFRVLLYLYIGGYNLKTISDSDALMDLNPDSKRYGLTFKLCFFLFFVYFQRTVIHENIS